jgi:hypothetical protein
VIKTCEALVAWGFAGRLETPRPCKQNAKPGERFCGLHLSKGASLVEVRDGAWCVGCGESGRAYVVGGVTISLCGKHGKALVKAIRDGR